MDRTLESGHHQMVLMRKIWPTITTHLVVIPVRMALLHHHHHHRHPHQAAHPVLRATHKI